MCGGSSTKQCAITRRDRKREGCTPKHMGLVPWVLACQDTGSGMGLLGTVWGQNDEKNLKQPPDAQTEGSTAMIV